MAAGDDELAPDGADEAGFETAGARAERVAFEEMISGADPLDPTALEPAIDRSGDLTVLTERTRSSPPANPRGWRSSLCSSSPTRLEPVGPEAVRTAAPAERGPSSSGCAPTAADRRAPSGIDPARIAGRRLRAVAVPAAPSHAS
jgi:hypothetical protein